MAFKRQKRLKKLKVPKAERFSRGQSGPRENQNTAPATAYMYADKFTKTVILYKTYDENCHRTIFRQNAPLCSVLRSATARFLSLFKFLPCEAVRVFFCRAF